MQNKILKIATLILILTAISSPVFTHADSVSDWYEAEDDTFGEYSDLDVYSNLNQGYQYYISDYNKYAGHNNTMVGYQFYLDDYNWYMNMY